MEDMPMPTVCERCSSEIVVSDSTEQYQYWRCVNGHNSLAVDRDMIEESSRPITATIAGDEPFPDGHWVELI